MVAKAGTLRGAKAKGLKWSTDRKIDLLRYEMRTEVDRIGRLIRGIEDRQRDLQTKVATCRRALELMNIDGAIEHRVVQLERIIMREFSPS